MKVQQELKEILEKKGHRNYSKGLRDSPNTLKYLIDRYGNIGLPQLFYLGLNPDVDYICSCGNVKSFKNIKDGFRQYCGLTCSEKNKNQSRKIKEKWDNRTKEEKNDIFEKYKKTNYKKYGVSNPVHNLYIKEKIKNTNQERYKADTPFQSDIIKDKIKKINHERYGTDYPFQNDGVRKKTIKTHIEKYGGLMVNARIKLDELYPQNPFSYEEIKEKIKKTNLERYGVPYPLQNEIIQNNRLETYREKYNRDNFSQIHIPEDVLNIFNNKNEFVKLIECNSILGLSKKYNVSERFITDRMILYDIALPGRSSYENQFKTFFDMYEIKYIQNTTKIIDSELDFYFPEHNVAIEICGLYYHSQYSKYGKTDKNYHYNKWKQCYKKGIQLLTIFEDEILLKLDIVNNMILYKLKYNSSKSIGARNIQVKQVNYNDSKLFFDKNHIQGGLVNSNINYAGFYDDKMISVMSFKRNSRGSYDYELVRFASDRGKYPGIASKMLKCFVLDHQPDTIVSFSDNRWSNGNLYLKTGFVEDGDIPCDYYYTDYKNRFHKSNFKKGRLKERFNVDITNKTELELTREIGYDRIWDCGKKRWVWKK